jgi:hypothetical protein
MFVTRSFALNPPGRRSALPGISHCVAAIAGSGPVRSFRADENAVLGTERMWITLVRCRIRDELTDWPEGGRFASAFAAISRATTTKLLSHHQVRK